MMRMQHQHTNRRITVTAVGAVLSLAFNYQQPWLCVVAWLAAFYQWREHRSQYEATVKLGQYIAVFFERNGRGFGWETRIAEVDGTASRNSSAVMKRSRLARLWLHLISLHSIASAGALLMAAALVVTKYVPTEAVWLLPVCLILGVVLHCAVLVVGLDFDIHEARTRWRGLFEAARAREERSFDAQHAAASSAPVTSAIGDPSDAPAA